MTEETLLEKTEKLMALVAAIAGERDDALKQLAATRAEKKDQMGAMLAQVESTVAQTLDTTELAPEPTDKELVPGAGRLPQGPARQMKGRA